MESHLGDQCGEKLNYCDECSKDIENKHVLKSHMGDQHGKKSDEKFNFCDKCLKDIESKHV